MRVLTLNLWGDQPPLERRLALAIEGIAALAPDVVTLQEVREVPGSVPNTAATLATALGMNHVYAAASSWSGGDEGLAILSRFPIARHASVELPHADKERRICLGASVVTDEGEVPVLTTHLHWRVSDGVKREDQVVALDDFANSWAPTAGLPRVLSGDFNATPAHDEIRFLRGQHTLAGRRAVWIDAWERAHAGQPGITWSSRNPYTKKMIFIECDRRLDYIFVTPPSREGRGIVTDCRVVLDELSGDGQLASDHFGVVADIDLLPLAR